MLACLHSHIYAIVSPKVVPAMLGTIQQTKVKPFLPQFLWPLIKRYPQTEGSVYFFKKKKRISNFISIIDVNFLMLVNTNTSFVT